MVCARGGVGDELSSAVEQPIILTTPHRTTDETQMCQWSRFSHCHNAIEIPNEMVISSMMVATMDV